MAGVYSVLELATALKPALLRHLLRDWTQGREGDAVLYLDADIVVYQPFPDVFDIAARKGIALTPHVLHPLPRDGFEPDEAALMHAGLFNLGFICLGRGAMLFVDWWHERLHLDAVVDLPNALFTDQRWVDWVPSLFGAAVLVRPAGHHQARHPRRVRQTHPPWLEAAGSAHMRSLIRQRWGTRLPGSSRDDKGDVGPARSSAAQRWEGYRHADAQSNRRTHGTSQ